jgi:four helix bundle protein
MRNPDNLAVTERALELAVAIYRLTSVFPSSERFGLAAQMRRAAVSVGSNIAEGCGRSGNRDFLRFLRIARGSSTELAFQLSLSAELGFGDPTEHLVVADLIDHLQRMLNRLSASVHRKATLPPASGRPAIVLRE